MVARMRLIDADELLTAFPVDDEPTLTKSCVRMTIQYMPTVDAVPLKHGRWKRKIVDCGFNADWVCSLCGHRVMTDFVNYKYCPECGARMDR